MIRYAIAAALLCLLPVYAPGQSSNITPASPTAGATLDLIGPTGPIQPGEEAELRLAGLTLDELQAAQDKGNFDLTAWPLAGLRIRSYYDWMDRKLKLDFRARDPGEYLVKLHLVRNGAQEIAAVVVTVTGDKPNPPVPPVPPTPVPGERFVLIVSETKDRTPQEAATLATLRRWLTDQKVQWRIVDPTTEAEWMRPHADKLKEAGVKGTALVVFAQPTDSHPGAYLAVEPLPGRSQEAIARIEEALK